MTRINTSKHTQKPETCWEIVVREPREVELVTSLVVQEDGPERRPLWLDSCDVIAQLRREREIHREEMGALRRQLKRAMDDPGACHCKRARTTTRPV